MVSAGQALGAYRRNQVQQASSVELVVLLYDRAIQLVRTAGTRLRDGDVAEKCRSLCWAVDIVLELQAVLDRERGGEIAARLDALYAYIINRLTAANHGNDPAAMEEAARLLEELREGWQALAQPAAARP